MFQKPRIFCCWPFSLLHFWLWMVMGKDEHSSWLGYRNTIIGQDRVCIQCIKPQSAYTLYLKGAGVIVRGFGLSAIFCSQHTLPHLNCVFPGTDTTSSLISVQLYKIYRNILILRTKTDLKSLKLEYLQKSILQPY